MEKKIVITVDENGKGNAEITNISPDEYVRVLLVLISGLMKGQYAELIKDYKPTEEKE